MREEGRKGEILFLPTYYILTATKSERARPTMWIERDFTQLFFLRNGFTTQLSVCYNSDVDRVAKKMSDTSLAFAVNVSLAPPSKYGSLEFDNGWRRRRRWQLPLKACTFIHPLRRKSKKGMENQSDKSPPPPPCLFFAS